MVKLSLLGLSYYYNYRQVFQMKIKLYLAWFCSIKRDQCCKWIFNQMKKIKFHQLPESNRLIIESIRLELKSQQIVAQKRGRFMTVPDQHNMEIFRFRKKKSQPNPIKILEPRHDNFSMPLKPTRWKTIEQEEMKRIKSNIQHKKLEISIDNYAQQTSASNEIVKIGSLIFVKNLFPDTSKNLKEKKKITNILKLKSFKGLNPIKITKTKQYLSNNLTVSPMKISVDLPKIQSKDTQVLRYVNKNDLINPYKQAERSLLLRRGDIKKTREAKPHEFSPWSTKCKIFNTQQPLNDKLI